MALFLDYLGNFVPTARSRLSQGLEIVCVVSCSQQPCLEQEPFAVEQVERSDLPGLVGRLRRAKRLFRLRNQNASVQIDLLSECLKPQDLIPNVELHLVA